VIAPSPWFPEAVRILNQHTNVDVGVHLALTSEWDNLKWRPLTDCPSLRDEAGFFFPMVHPNKNYPGRSIVENPWKLEEVEAELRAQIELAKRLIPRISHVSGHMGCTGLNPAVRAMVARLGKEYGLRVEAGQGVKGVSYAGPKTSPDEKLASFIEMLRRLEPGKTYVFVDHPGLDTPELRAIHHVGYENVALDRQGVTDTLTHPKVKELVKEKGVTLIGYRDLPEP